MLLALVSVAALASASAQLATVFEGAGYTADHYRPLQQALPATGEELCLAHSKDGVAAAAAAILAENGKCAGGAVFLGGVPEAALLQKLQVPTLVVAGTHDGVTRLSEFAAARHQSTKPEHHFAVVDGASHASFVSATAAPTDLVAALDLRPSIAATEAHSRVGALVSDFALLATQKQLRGTSSGALRAGEALALQLSKPLVDALMLEGSSKLGTPWCNSDFPTNPTCGYSKYPDFSLPGGPAKPPSPPLPANCVCGSAWVTDYANPLVSGAAIKGFEVTTRDAFHDVRDEHPFHLPHIWSKCESPASCTLNMTTLTMPVLEAGDLFPDLASPPLSAIEMKSKMKSRQVVWKAVGLGKQDKAKTDMNMSICREVNEKAWSYALENAETSVRERFLEQGEPFVMVDDVVAPIGAGGPQWIQDQLKYTRVVGAGNKSHIEIQAYTFVVGEFPIQSRFVPDGMHYCKLLSPARAMEWIYTDGLRRSLQLSSSTSTIKLSEAERLESRVA